MPSKGMLWQQAGCRPTAQLRALALSVQLQMTSRGIFKSPDNAVLIAIQSSCRKVPGRLGAGSELILAALGKKQSDFLAGLGSRGVQWGGGKEMLRVLFSGSPGPQAPRDALQLCLQGLGEVSPGAQILLAAGSDPEPCL